MKLRFVVRPRGGKVETMPVRVPGGVLKDAVRVEAFLNAFEQRHRVEVLWIRPINRGGASPRQPFAKGGAA